MKMRFAVCMGFGLTMHDVGGHARAAEQAGFSHLAFVDTPNIARDVHVMMTQAALETERIHIGHGVTDPWTLHPASVANAAASIGELSGGRVFVGIGAGGPFGKVMKARPLEELRTAVRFIKRYTAGEEAHWNGTRMHSEWIRHPLRVHVACNGPKACEVAGEVGDCAIIGGALDSHILRWKISRIEAGARNAGRNPADVDKWVTTSIGVASSKEAARQKFASFAIAKARGVYALLLKSSPDSRYLRELLEEGRPGLVEELKNLYEAYDLYKLESTGAIRTDLATQDVVDLFLVTGTVREVSEKIEGLGHVGIKGIFNVLPGNIDAQASMREIGAKIMPRFMS